MNLLIINPHFLDTAKYTNPVFEVLTFMAEYGFSAVPVVNNHVHGKIIGTFSISDLKPLLVENCSTDLYYLVKELKTMTVAQFLLKGKIKLSVSSQG